MGRATLPEGRRIAFREGAASLDPRESGLQFCGAPPVAWYEGPDFVKSVPSAKEVRSEEAWLIVFV